MGAHQSLLRSKGSLAIAGRVSVLCRERNCLAHTDTGLVAEVMASLPEGLTTMDTHMDGALVGGKLGARSITHGSSTQEHARCLRMREVGNAAHTPKAAVRKHSQVARRSRQADEFNAALSPPVGEASSRSA